MAESAGGGSKRSCRMVREAVREMVEGMTAYTGREMEELDHYVNITLEQFNPTESRAVCAALRKVVVYNQKTILSAVYKAVPLRGDDVDQGSTGSLGRQQGHMNPEAEEWRVPQLSFAAVWCEECERMLNVAQFSATQLKNVQGPLCKTCVGVKRRQEAEKQRNVEQLPAEEDREEQTSGPNQERRTGG